MFHFKVTPKRNISNDFVLGIKVISSCCVKRTEALRNQARVRFQKPGQIHAGKPQTLVAAPRQPQPSGLRHPHCHSCVGFCSEPHISGSIPFLILLLFPKDVNKVGKYFQYEI